MNRQDFTDKFFPVAIEAAKDTPIFPETVISAAGLESGWNTSTLSMKYNNFFGFKISANWTGKIASLPTQEEINGRMVTVNANFRWYDSPLDSFKDYVRLLQTKHYVDAGVTVAKDSLSQFQALQKAGYATDTNYASKLSSVYYTIRGFFVDSSTYIKNIIADNPKISAAAGVGLIAVLVTFLIVFKSKVFKK